MFIISLCVIAILHRSRQLLYHSIHTHTHTHTHAVYMYTHTHTHRYIFHNLQIPVSVIMVSNTCTFFLQFTVTVPDNHIFYILTYMYWLRYNLFRYHLLHPIYTCKLRFLIYIYRIISRYQIKAYFFHW